jgi:hypothetical protein
MNERGILTEQLSAKDLFKQRVKSLVTHEHAKQDSYIASYRVRDENKILTIVYNPPVSLKEEEVEIPGQYLAFLVEPVEINGFKIYVRESYHANGYVGIHYGVSIARYEDREGRKHVMREDSGEPLEVFNDGSLPVEVREALRDKVNADIGISPEEKISGVIDLMGQNVGKDKKLEKIKEKRGHVHWHLLRKH